MDKVPIELSPYDALNIYIIVSEIDDVLQERQGVEAIRESIKTFMDQVAMNIRKDQIEDAKVERAVKRLLGKEP